MIRILHAVVGVDESFTVPVYVAFEWLTAPSTVMPPTFTFHNSAAAVF